MRILVVGASQGTGAECVKNALEKGHQVTAFARSPKKLAIENAALTKVAGDFFNLADLERVMPGHDAVIVTASVSKLSTFKEKPDYFSAGTAFTVQAMKKAGVKRLVILSALGAGESRALANPILRFLVVDRILKAAFLDHNRQEQLVKESGLEWVIARPTRLTNGPSLKKYQAKTAVESVPGAISRGDVADFMVEACVKPDWVGHAVQLGG
ncbi:MAG: NAD(P)H-binding protein [Deltaproteobacteria bacterium]|nr:NAD(P)H-binding protein [Deltaproteobacteria bacterium]